MLILIPVFWYFGISKEVKLNHQKCKAKQNKERPFTMEKKKKNYKKVSKLGTIKVEKI